MADNNSLRPEQRADKHGKVVTRWVKDGSNVVPSASLAQVPLTSDAGKPVPNDINWNRLSVKQGEILANSVAAGLDDPDSLWKNFDFYTGMLGSRHSRTALESMLKNNAAIRLRDAWMNKHGLSLDVPESFSSVSGSEGTDAYRAAYDKFYEARRKAELSLYAPNQIPVVTDWNDVSPDQARKLAWMTSESLDNINSVWDNLKFYKGMLESKNSGTALGLIAENDVINRIQEAWLKSHNVTNKERDAFGVGIPQEESDRFHQQIANFKMAMHTAETKATVAPPAQPKKQSTEHVPATEVVGRKVDEALDAVFDGVESINHLFSERHTGEIPKDIGGSTVAWSDLNPFKSWGRKKR